MTEKSWELTNWSDLPSDWEEKAKELDQTDWQKRGEYEYIKTGKCPRCDHWMTVRAEPGLVHKGDALIETDQKIMAFCNCAHQHSNHPEEPKRSWGCGWHGEINTKNITKSTQ